VITKCYLNVDEEESFVSLFGTYVVYIVTTRHERAVGFD